MMKYSDFSKVARARLLYHKCLSLAMGMQKRAHIWWIALVLFLLHLGVSLMIFVTHLLNLLGILVYIICICRAWHGQGKPPTESVRPGSILCGRWCVGRWIPPSRFIHPSRVRSVQSRSRLGLIEMSKGGGAFVLCCRTDGPRHRDCLSVERLQINSIVDADAAADVFRFKRNGRQRRRGETIRRMWLAVAVIRYFSVENQWVNEFRGY